MPGWRFSENEIPARCDRGDRERPASVICQCVLSKHRAVLLASARMSYRPAPIETSGNSLPPALAALTERLAENAHDLWAAQRLADGWTFGAQRDDAAKKHPCLIPYAELPESEKTYDRQTAMGTVKAMLALGYRIEHGPAN